ncbi:hypothetical protein EDB19DRAFT_2009346, partial [Suillus lakei]
FCTPLSSFFTSSCHSLQDCSVRSSVPLLVEGKRLRRPIHQELPVTGQSFFTIVQLVSSQRPKGLKPFVLPQNVVLRQLEDARCRTTQGQEIASSTNTSDPELGRCNVVNPRGSPRLSHPLSVRPELPMPSFSPPSSYALPKHSHEYVLRSSWPPVFDTQLQSGKNSLPGDADLSMSLSSASLKLPIRQGAGENRFASPFGDRGSTYFAPYFKGVPSVASAADLLDFSVYASSPRVDVDYSSAVDTSGETQRRERQRFTAKISTALEDATSGKLVPSTPPSSSISSVSDWSPSGLFTSVGEQTSSSSPYTTHTRSLSAVCISSPCDLSADEIGGIQPGSGPRVSVRPVGFAAKKNLVPETVSCPEIPGSVGRATTREVDCEAEFA